jgi:1,2-phenylacetyl-CoA epoxidase PaaB subunit
MLEDLLMEKGNVGANHAVGINVVKCKEVAASTGAATERNTEPDKEPANEKVSKKRHNSLSRLIFAPDPPDTWRPGQVW